ncbi:hypothetical protein MP477_16770, partial [Chryseobacterium sp. WG23]|uniref:hypothetical protein n=1 Tax=Chryseobacterium sp. WG23 TaxID=2926910 RepID=UPI00211EC602
KKIFSKWHKCFIQLSLFQTFYPIKISGCAKKPSPFRKVLTTPSTVTNLILSSIKSLRLKALLKFKKTLRLCD